MNNLKIAFVSDAVYPWNVGGLETLESAEAQELAKHHELHFFSLQWPGMEKKDFRKNGIMYHTMYRIDPKNFYRHGRRSIREALIFSASLFRIFFYRFDYIQSNEFPILQIPLLRIYCSITGCRLILDMHEVWDREYWIDYLGGGIRGNLANAFASWVLKMADAYVVNSSVTAVKLASLGVPESKIHEFSPVINDEELKSIQDSGGSKLVVFSGRLIKEKRLDKWIKAVKAASTKVKGMRALIIGEGPEQAELKKLIRRLRLDKIVGMRKFYHTEKKNELYKAIKGAKVLLQMSEREGLSIIVLESLALGTPVLLPSHSPIPEEVKKMCVITDEISIPYELEKILKSSDKRKYLRNTEELNNFSISRINAFYSNLFRKLRQ